jgi:L-lysine 6-transaminase
LRAAQIKIANSDVYSEAYAEFVETFVRVAGLPPLERYLFIEGGALAIENTLKAAMDWKVRKNIAAGRGERGTEILHFRKAFHGRSGYTMSLTNTDPRKTDLFAKFKWPRVSNPHIDFSLPESEQTKDVIAREKQSEQEIMKFIEERGIDIAAIIIEPIQGEGGDNHFRGEWLQTLRRICDENEMLLIFDEIQCGMGTTGRNWCCEHFGVKPDLMAFGKKVQVCGVMAGPRLDEVQDNAFRLPSRLNSTWGGNFTDMVRSTHFLRIIEEENLVANAAKVGQHFLKALHELQRDEPIVTAVRGRGLFLAFDLPDPETRDEFWKGVFDRGALVLKSGERAIRFRPALDISAEVVDEAMELLREQCRAMRR